MKGQGHSSPEKSPTTPTTPYVQYPYYHCYLLLLLLPLGTTPNYPCSERFMYRVYAFSMCCVSIVYGIHVFLRACIGAWIVFFLDVFCMYLDLASTACMEMW